jgi:arsenate reductase (thioredoxin)
MAPRGKSVTKPLFDDPATRHVIRQGIARPRDEFRGIVSEQTIQRFVDEAIAALSGARVKDDVPLFVNRFARERLRALAQIQAQRAAGRVQVRSAGSTPADAINPAVVAAMAEVGIDLTQEFPKPLTDEFVRAADVVITMGCDDACPIYPGKRYEDWEVDDPAGQSLAAVRRIRDDVDRRVRGLMATLVPLRAPN